MATQTTDLSPPPIQTPFLDQNGKMSIVWLKWFQNLHVRVGGPVATSNTDIQSQVTTNTNGLNQGPVL